MIVGVMAGWEAFVKGLLEETLELIALGAGMAEVDSVQGLTERWEHAGKTAALLLKENATAWADAMDELKKGVKKGPRSAKEDEAIQIVAVIQGLKGYIGDEPR